MTGGPVLSVEDLTHVYGGRPVLRDVSFTLQPGCTLAIVGESGAGKSTLSRLVAGIEAPTAGRVTVAGMTPSLRFGVASPVQMVFQQPAEALNRFLSVEASVREGLRHLPRPEQSRRAAQLLELVGVDPARARDRPRMFSGGQLQRIVLARALAAEPTLLLCDEPTSALDVSVQAQIVNLLLSLQEQRGFSCLLVTHDLGVARVLADEILVLHGGAMVELTPADAFFAGPATSYGQALLQRTTEQMLTRGRDGAG